MKKILAILISFALCAGIAISPVYAAGGQNRGDVGQGETDQGDTGSDTGNAQGDDAQGHQAD